MPDYKGKNNPNYKHGMSHTKIHQVWSSMIDRCTNENCRDYKNYGGRGIGIASRWMEFVNFYEDMGDQPDGMTLDRKNNDEDYAPENCHWVTRAEQSRNTRRNRIIEFDGKKMCVNDWAKTLGMKRQTILNRLNYGWPVQRVLTEPVR